MLLQVYKQTGRKPPELAQQPERPQELMYLWEYFLDVRQQETLSYTELANWCKLRCVNLHVWEVDVLKALDRLYWVTLYD